ncbi:MAG: hypothetical protein DSZ06_03980, partial [Sulfurospirillum sp.]
MREKIVGILLFLVGILLLGRCSSVHEDEKKKIGLEEKESLSLAHNEDRYSYERTQEILQKEKRVLYPKDNIGTKETQETKLSKMRDLNHEEISRHFRHEHQIQKEIQPHKDMIQASIEKSAKENLQKEHDLAKTAALEALELFKKEMQDKEKEKQEIIKEAKEEALSLLEQEEIGKKLSQEEANKKAKEKKLLEQYRILTDADRKLARLREIDEKFYKESDFKIEKEMDWIVAEEGLLEKERIKNAKNKAYLLAVANKKRAEEEAKKRAEAERLAKLKAEEEARKKAEAERLAKLKAEEEAKRKAEEEAKKKAEAERLAKLKAEEEAKRLAREKEELAKRAKAERDRIAGEEDEARRLVQEQKKKQNSIKEKAILASLALAAQRAKAEEDAQKKFEEEEAKRKAEEEARKKAEAERLAKLKAEEEAKKKAEAER